MTALFLGAATALIGRIFLAWLPPGLPGRHAPRDLPGTWAASVVVGLVWWTWVGAVVASDALPFVLIGVPAIALAARLATLPGALVPRHEPVARADSRLARSAVFVAVLAASLAGTRRESVERDLVHAVASLAAAILANEALSAARVPASIRASVLALLALALATDRSPVDPLEHVLVATCGVAAGAVGWIRRGDRRALALAAVAIALLALDGRRGGPIALGVAACLVVGSARPSRRRAFAWTFGALFLGILPSVGRSLFGAIDAATEIPSAWSRPALVIAIAASAACAAGIALMRRREASSWNPSGAPVAREALVLACGALASVAVVLLRQSIDAHVPPLSIQALPISLLIAIAAAILLSRGLERGPRVR